MDERSFAVPARLNRRPRDHRGFVVPYFVQWLDERDHPVPEPEGRPNFLVVNPKRRDACVVHRRCWLCGEPLGALQAFVIGPMCAITRTTSEPGCHRECAEYAVKACPFLARPGMKAGRGLIRGVSLDRNPGAMAIWITKSAKPFAANGGYLLRVGDPVEVTWWAESRPATRAEVMASIVSGLPALREMAEAEGPEAIMALARHVARVEPYLPAEQMRASA